MVVPLLSVVYSEEGCMRSPKKEGKATRSFAVKGVFRYVWLYAKPHRKRRVWFESRVARVDGRTERGARAAAHRLFEADSFRAKWPAPDVASTAVEYLGIGRVLEIGVELEPNELWWEMVDEQPSIEDRANPARRSGRRRGG
jgi:hypothetical protein